MKKISERLQTTAPVLIKRLRSTGLIITSIALAVLLAPVHLSEHILSISGFFFISGVILATACQLLHSDSVNTTIKGR